MRYSNQHLHAFPASPDGMAQLPEMIEACAAAGLRIATFTDHMDMADEPTGRAKNTYPLRRRFFEERRALAEGLAPPELDVRFGMELGAALQLPEEALAAASMPGLDFIIASVHNLPDVPDFHFYTFADEAECEALNHRYLAELIKLADFPNFDVMGHIGYTSRYMKMQGFNGVLTLEKYGDELTTLLRRLIQNGKGIECNTSGYRSGGRGTFPSEEILRLYRSLGGEIITVGSDGHKPSHAALGLREGFELLKACSFRYVAEFRERKCTFTPLD